MSLNKNVLIGYLTMSWIGTTQSKDYNSLFMHNQDFEDFEDFNNGYQMYNRNMDQIHGTQFNDFSYQNLDNTFTKGGDFRIKTKDDLDIYVHGFLKSRYPYIHKVLQDYKKV